MSGDDESAEQTLLDAVTRTPIEPRALLELAEVSERLGHDERARDALVSYRALSPNDDSTAERLAPSARIGDLARRTGDAQAALRWYRRASDLAPADGRLLGRVAEMALQTGDVELARRYLERAIELSPGNRALRSLRQKIG
jgi:Flp pilus assembly protein TadD